MEGIALSVAALILTLIAIRGSYPQKAQLVGSPCPCSLNETRFERYRKFGSESRLLAASEPPDAVTPRAALPGPSPGAAPPVAEPAAPPLPEAPSIAAPPEALPAPPPQVSAAVLPQPPPESVPPPAHPAAPDATWVFREQVNLIPLRVVVRDSQGRAVGGLQKNDFEILDEGRRQSIAFFSVEQYSPPRQPEPSAGGAQPGPGAPVMPERFVLFLFDDLNLNAGELLRAREAASRVLRESPDPATRFAVDSTSGRASLGFTADRGRASETLNRLAPAFGAGTGCPEVSYYVADQIVNRGSQDALLMVVREAVQQCDIDPRFNPRHISDTDISYARTRASEVVSAHETATGVALEALKAGIGKMTRMSGERTIVLVSPGFLTPGLP